MSAPRRLRILSAALVLAAAAPTVARADGPPAQGTIVATLEDGSSMPLHNWALSYEYAMAKQGVSPLFAPTARKNTPELYLGKKSIPTAGQTLIIRYLESMRSTETDTGIKTEKVKTVRDLSLAGPGGAKAATLKIEPPARELLAPALEKNMTLAARTLDLVGETITGTKRSFCLWSYTPVVECGGTSADRVVKIEFQP